MLIQFHTRSLQTHVHLSYFPVLEVVIDGKAHHTLNALLLSLLNPKIIQTSIPLLFGETYLNQQAQMAVPSPGEPEWESWLSEYVECLVESNVCVIILCATSNIVASPPAC
jgi:hypothetical protein